MRRLALPFVLFPLTLAGCKQGYSPNTYAASAAQAEATVQRGVIIGVRQVLISATGAVGAATGGAAGGVAGSQIAGAPVVTALGAIGGTLVGGIGGAAAAQAVGDSKGWEYIVQESGDKLVSVTQTSKTALPLGMHVLVIAGAEQARIVPDYTVEIPQPPPAAANPTATSGAPDGTTYEIHVTPTLPPADNTPPMPQPPTPVAADPTTPAPPPTPTPSSAPTAPAAPAFNLPPPTSSPATQ